jgi:hypothetical protein
MAKGGEDQKGIEDLVVQTDFSYECKQFIRKGGAVKACGCPSKERKGR